MGSKLHTDAATVGEARWLEGRRRRGGGKREEGNRNESSNTGGAKHVCAWRGRRGGTERLDFSDSEFCSSFFLPLSLSHAHPLITDSPYLPTCTTFSPAYHSFLRPRALSTTTPPSYATFSLDPPVSSALYNTASGRPNRWCRCRHNKNVEKAMANVHVNGERKSPADRVLGYPYGGGTEESRRFSEQLFMKHLTRFHDRDSFFLLPPFRRGTKDTTNPEGEPS